MPADALSRRMRPRTNPAASSRAALTLAVALAAMLAGCADAVDPAADAPGTAAGGVKLEFEPAAGGGVADAPHVHDYWAGRERVTLLDEDFTVQPPTALFWGAATTLFLGETAFGGAFVSFPEGAIVYEGTGRMEITVTWTDPSITGIRFLHRHAGSGELQPWIETPNGDTVVLDVAPEMTDMPHAQASRWGFLMTASGTPAVAVGTFSVRIDIVKMRDVAEWPAHPDLWDGEARLTVLDAEGEAPARVALTEVADTGPWAVPADTLPAQRLVPMEAGTLRVTVTILDRESAAGIDEIRLLARTANDVAFDFTDQGKPVEASDDGTTFTWERAIEMDETDNPYADASAWGFRVVARAVNAPLPYCEHGCYQAELRYHIHAVVEKATPEA